MPVPSNWSHQLREFVKKWNAVTDRSEQEKYLGDRPFDNFVLTEHATSWQDFPRMVEGASRLLVFPRAKGVILVARYVLDRAVKVEYAGANRSGYYHLDRETEQRELFLRFQQQAHHHIGNLPSIDDFASWLAVMQHHGVPTRLLDWSPVAIRCAVLRRCRQTMSLFSGMGDRSSLVTGERARTTEF